MRKQKKIWLPLLWIIAMGVGIAGRGPEVLADDAFSKLGRGASNTVLGWGEFLRQTELACKEKGRTLCVFTGLARGAWWSFVRTSAGLYEILTFPFEGPQNYAPILEPENVFAEVGNSSGAIT